MNECAYPTRILGCRSRSGSALRTISRTSEGMLPWVSDPYRLVGNLERSGDRVTSGQDYLLAYWIARHHGLVAEGE